MYAEAARVGDHVCYISNVARFRADYPEWDVSVPLDAIFDEFALTHLDAVGLARR